MTVLDGIVAGVTLNDVALPDDYTRQASWWVAPRDGQAVEIEAERMRLTLPHFRCIFHL